MTKSMGLGALGQTQIKFIHKVRWTFEGQFGEHKLDPIFVKLHARPNIEEVSFISEGQTENKSQNTITTSIFDFNDKNCENLWSVLQYFYHFDGKPDKKDVALGVGMLKLWNGCGEQLESWALDGLWPSSINFGDLDFSSSDSFDVEITWVYQTCKYLPVLPIHKDKPTS